MGATVSLSVFEIDLLSKDKNPESNRLTLAGLDFWGLPQKAVIGQFVEQQFDVLLNFSLNQSEVFDYITIKSKAKFKVSAIVTSPYSDLIVAHGSNASVNFIGEFVRILENLKNRS